MNAPLRRHACPGFVDPMPTGDGLLARLMPSGKTIALDRMRSLCEAARAHGNGIVEVTSRGSIQLRGFTAKSHLDFVRDVMPLGIATEGLPLICDPLAGLDPHVALDAAAFASALRQAVPETLYRSIGPKVSVLIDAGSELHLDAIAADLRLRAVGDGTHFQVALGGNAHDAIVLGNVAPRHAIGSAVRLLKIVAERGRTGRARDIIRAHGKEIFLAALRGVLIEKGALPRRSPAEPLRVHSLRDGSVALGVGLAFGHTDAQTLQQLLAAARRSGAAGLRTAARTLLVIGITPTAAAELAATADRLGFIARPNDPRRHIAACAGAPICAAAQIPARAIAQAIAEAAAGMLDGSFMLHLSGCAKGCAHPAASRLSIVGRDGRADLVLSGSAIDAGIAQFPTDACTWRLARLADAIADRDRSEDAAAALARLGADRVQALLAEASDG
jgi:precorrin-3B synthase